MSCQQHAFHLSSRIKPQDLDFIKPVLPLKNFRSAMCMCSCLIQVEGLYEKYCIQWRICQGAVNMKQAFSLSPSSRASTESLLELNRNHRHSLEVHTHTQKPKEYLCNVYARVTNWSRLAYIKTSSFQFKLIIKTRKILIKKNKTKKNSSPL